MPTKLSLDLGAQETRIYELHESFNVASPWEGRLRVVNIPKDSMVLCGQNGGESTQGAGDHFIRVIDGAVGITQNIKRTSRGMIADFGQTMQCPHIIGQFGQLPKGDIGLCTKEIPACVVICTCATSTIRSQCLWDEKNLREGNTGCEHECISLLTKTKLDANFEYESYFLPSQRCTPTMFYEDSYHFVIITSGYGWAGLIPLGRSALSKVITPITAGDILHIPDGTPYSFKAGEGCQALWMDRFTFVKSKKPHVLEGIGFEYPTLQQERRHFNP